MRANENHEPDIFSYEIADIIRKLDPELHLIDLKILMNSFKHLAADELTSLFVKVNKDDFIAANQICKAIIKNNIHACC